MFKSLLYPKQAERRNLEIFIMGFIYASASIFISYWIFHDYSSIAMVFLCVLPTIYVLQGILKSEESVENISDNEEWILKEHLKKLFFMMFLFLGFVFAFTIWSFFLEPSKTDVLFKIQKETFISITQLTGSSIFSGNFFDILTNNLKVMSLSLIFAIFYGAGAIFILAWNASVMGFVIGTIAKETATLSALPLAFLKYFIHGIPEMFSYIVAAMAGGILFIAFLKGHLTDIRKVKRIAIGVTTLVLISILLLIVAALLEIYVSTLI